MKYSFLFLPVILLLSACAKPGKGIVDISYVDSLVSNYTPSQTETVNKGDLLFWQKRMENQPDNYVNGPKYAAALLLRFHLYGNIYDLIKADSLLAECNKAYAENEDGILLKLAAVSLLRHKFGEASAFVEKAQKISGQTYATNMTDFDASFETGQYQKAAKILQTAKPDSNYAWYFRRSKYEHYAGNLDEAIHCMLMAVKKSNGNKYLAQAALSNAGDLYIHKGDLAKAYEQYLSSLKLDAADFHSMTGIGWIAMMKDKNYPLAKKIFSFVKEHTYSPDVLLKLEQLAEATNDSASQKKYASEFDSLASLPAYGGMYNKYLIALYTGILNHPAKALQLAGDEINNRTTPQTFAWYAWSLLQNNQPEKAYRIYQSSVSGRPLEGPELYYMGKLMQQEDKNYNALQFFKAAWINRYDLSPSQAKDIENNLD